MHRSTIYYQIPQKYPKNIFTTLKIRNYRFLNNLPQKIFEENQSRVKIITRQLKYLKKVNIPTSHTSSVCHSIKANKTLKEVIYRKPIPELFRKYMKESLALIICQCKGLKTLCIEGFTEYLIDEQILQYFKALVRLNELSISISDNDIKNLPKLLANKKLEKLNLVLQLSHLSQKSKPVNIHLNASEVSLLFKLDSLLSLDLLGNTETHEIIQYLQLNYIQDSNHNITSVENFKKMMDSLTNLKSLHIDARSTKADFFKQALSPSLASKIMLDNFVYSGPFMGPEFQDFQFDCFPNKLTVLKLEVDDFPISCGSLENFVLQLKKLTNLREFDFKTNDLLYANEFVHALPHNLSNLRIVTFVFGKSEEQRNPLQEPKLHMNSFLDWLISLPKLEEVYLSHPFINYCYCNFLDNHRLASTLRRATILETSKIYDLSLIEVEFTNLDLAAALKLLLSQNLEHFQFSIHMEFFKQRMLDFLEEIILKCPKLKQINVEIWFNILNEKLIYKLEKTIAALYYVPEKNLNVRYYQIANKEAQDIVDRRLKPNGFNYSTVNYIGLCNGVLKQT